MKEEGNDLIEARILMSSAHSRASALALVSKKGDALMNVAEFKGDKEVVLAAVTSVSADVDALFYAAADLREDKQVVMAAVSHKGNGRALRYTHSLRSDRDVVLAAVKTDGDALQFASPDLKDDLEIVETACAQHPWALQYASTNARNNRKCVLAAVTREGKALRCASDDLRQNREVALAAVSQDNSALQFVLPPLQQQLGKEQQQHHLPPAGSRNPTQQAQLRSTRPW